MTEEVVNQMDPNVTDDDKLWTALAFVFTPLVPIILLLMDDKKDRPFIKFHNMPALLFGIVWYVVAGVLSAVIIGLCMFPVGLVLQLFWAYKAYQGEYVEIPLLTDFVKNQGW